MSCKRCGECCHDPTIVVSATGNFDEIEFERWIRGFGFPVDRQGNLMYVKVKGVCAYLNEENLCSIYPMRPEICKRYDCP